MKKIILILTVLFVSLPSFARMVYAGDKQVKLTKKEMAEKTKMSHILRQVTEAANEEYKAHGFYPDHMADLGLSKEVTKKLEKYEFDYFGNDSEFEAVIQFGNAKLRTIQADELTIIK